MDQERNVLGTMEGYVEDTLASRDYKTKQLMEKPKNIWTKEKIVPTLLIYRNNNQQRQKRASPRTFIVHRKYTNIRKLQTSMSSELSDTNWHV